MYYLERIKQNILKYKEWFNLIIIVIIIIASFVTYLNITHDKRYNKSQFKNIKIDKSNIDLLKENNISFIVFKTKRYINFLSGGSKGGWFFCETFDKDDNLVLSYEGKDFGIGYDYNLELYDLNHPKFLFKHKNILRKEAVQFINKSIPFIVKLQKNKIKKINEEKLKKREWEEN